MDARDGHLVCQYIEFCKLRKLALETGVFDISRHSWLYPTMILPMVVFLNENPQIRLITPTASSVTNYLNVLRGAVPNSGKSYVPVVVLPASSEEADRMLSYLYALADAKTDLGGPNTRNAFRYLVGEMTDNIYEHSEFKSARVLAQRWARLRTAEVVICDDGITIKGAFKKNGWVYDGQSTAVMDALSGLSTKLEKERGTGLPTNLKIWTEGVEGAFLIVSGDEAVYCHRTTGPKVYKLSEEFRYNGTMISVSFPIPCNVDVYDFIH